MWHSEKCDKIQHLINQYTIHTLNVNLCDEMSSFVSEETL